MISVNPGHSTVQDFGTTPKVIQFSFTDYCPTMLASDLWSLHYLSHHSKGNKPIGYLATLKTEAIVGKLAVWLIFWCDLYHVLLLSGS